MGALSQGLVYPGNSERGEDERERGRDSRLADDKGKLGSSVQPDAQSKSDDKDIVVYSATELQPSSKGVCCLVRKFAQLNLQLGQKWEEAWQKGLHLWVLLQDGELVEPQGFMPADVPRCTPRATDAGYTVQCWVCGLTLPTARLKAASKFHCSYAGLAAGRPLREVGKVLIHRRVWPLFSKWLQTQNELPERRELHWPVLLPLESNQTVDGDGYKLKCSKCGLVLEHAREKAMLEARCKRTSATTALARTDEQAPRLRSRI